MKKITCIEFPRKDASGKIQFIDEVESPESGVNFASSSYLKKRKEN